MSPPKKLGRYELVRKIAAGGMAEVYQAKLIGIHGFEKSVAIKKILPQWSANPEFLRMLVAEAKVLLSLSHPNIVQVFELNKDGDDHYLVIELVDGLDLKRVMELLHSAGQKIPLPMLVFLATEMFTGLQFAHSRVVSIIHRDISPQNVLLSFSGDVKLTDFGIAKAVGQSTDTVTGTLKGKFAYMSPEQAVGARLDARSDLFSLGLVLYEMVTQTKCFDGDSDLEIIEQAKRAFIRFELWDDDYPAELKEFIGYCLKKNPEERLQSAGEALPKLALIEKNLGKKFGREELQTTLSANLFQQHRLTDPAVESVPTNLHRATKLITKKTSPRSFYWLRVFLAASLILAGLVWWRASLLPESEPPAPLPPKAKLSVEPAPELIKTEIPVPEVTAVEQKAVELELQPIMFGSLQVLARPWGQVYLGDLVQGSETPASISKIPVGAYTLKIFYPPLGQWLSTKIIIKENSTVICRSKFGKESTIHCQ